MCYVAARSVSENKKGFQWKGFFDCLCILQRGFLEIYKYKTTAPSKSGRFWEFLWLHSDPFLFSVVLKTAVMDFLEFSLTNIRSYYPGDTWETCRSSGALPGRSWRTSSRTSGRGSRADSWIRRWWDCDTVLSWTLLAGLLPYDAVVLASPSVHTVVGYRALAAVQGASLPLSHCWVHQ